ncbi:LexA family transcriptional regulator [Thalassospira marina]|nr:LexA family transcriptional regulator [Thalassospira marina]
MGKRLSKALKDAGMSQAELARAVGASQQAINFIATDKTANPRNIEKIARALGVEEAWLRFGNQNGPELQRSPTPPPAPIVSNFAPDLAKDLPIRGTSNGISESIKLSANDVQGYTSRPAFLVGNMRAFAVYMNGPIMEPRYFAGELLLIDPVRPSQQGDFVLAELQSGECLVRQLTKIGSESITLGSLNPEEETQLPRDDVRHLHRIAGSWDI